MQYLILIYSFLFMQLLIANSSTHNDKGIRWTWNEHPPFFLSIQLNQQQLKEGEILKIEAVFNYPATYRLDTPALIDQFIGMANPLRPKFSLIESQIMEANPTAGHAVQTLTLTLLPLEKGSLSASLLLVTFQPLNDQLTQIDIPTPIFNVEITPNQDFIPTYAPLLPLRNEFPLQLSSANRQLIIDDPTRLKQEMQSIYRLVEAHAFPWTTLFVLMSLTAISWVAYLLRDLWRKRPLKKVKQLSSYQAILQQWKILEQYPLTSPELLLKYTYETHTLLLDMLKELTGKPVQQMQTLEFQSLIENEPSLSSIKNELTAFLTAVDEIKFAHHSLTPTTLKQGKEALLHILSILSLTLRKELD